MSFHNSINKTESNISICYYHLIKTTKQHKKSIVISSSNISLFKKSCELYILNFLRGENPNAIDREDWRCTPVMFDEFIDILNKVIKVAIIKAPCYEILDELQFSIPNDTKFHVSKVDLVSWGWKSSETSEEIINRIKPLPSVGKNFKDVACYRWYIDQTINDLSKVIIDNPDKFDKNIMPNKETLEKMSDIEAQKLALNLHNFIMHIWTSIDCGKFNINNKTFSYQNWFSENNIDKKKADKINNPLDNWWEYQKNNILSKIQLIDQHGSLFQNN